MPADTAATDSTPSFAELGISPNLVPALKRAGIDAPFPIQVATLPDAIAGRDILGRGQTGSGKTLAFGLALLTRLDGRRAMMTSPTFTQRSLESPRARWHCSLKGNTP